MVDNEFELELAKMKTLAKQHQEMNLRYTEVIEFLTEHAGQLDSDTLNSLHELLSKHQEQIWNEKAVVDEFTELD